jgi:hypothetical protein
MKSSGYVIPWKRTLKAQAAKARSASERTQALHNKAVINWRSPLIGRPVYVPPVKPVAENKN